MPYLVHTAHAQFVALWVGVIGWILTMVALGLVQWRIWVVSDVSSITSGLAWVGIWRTCFYTHAKLASEYEVMYCQHIRLSDDFTPSEIAAAQPLMVLAFIIGLFGNSILIYGLRNVYFGLEGRRLITLAFSLGGGLLILASVTAFVPIFWNLNSVLTNQTIDFPPEFFMPPAPQEQYVGPGIAVGIFASVLVLLSGVVCLAYRFPENLSPKAKLSWPKSDQPGMEETGMALSQRPTPTCSQDRINCHGVDNFAFES